MHESATELLVNAIRDEKPLVLVAGQGFGIPFGSPNVLSLFRSRVGHSDEHFGWQNILDKPLSSDDKAFLVERFDRAPLLPNTRCAIDLPWSAVFTSSIDPRFAKRFHSRGRQPETIFSRRHYARVSRSRSRPPIHYLFGQLAATTPDANAPKSRIELAQRKQTHATELMNRIADTATAHGLVVIDGLCVHGDWLDADDLFASLLSQQVGNVLWFQAPTEPSTELVLAMQSTGALYKIKDSLGTCVATMQAEGSLDLSEISAPEDPAQITIANGIIDISPQLRLRVEASANIVDDSWTAKPDVLDEDQRHEVFRAFHGDLGTVRNLVEGIEHGFAIEREFEGELMQALEAALRNVSKSDGLIVLHGQSATGKSVAISRLAWRIRVSHRLPVLICLGRMLTNFEGIDEFCAAGEAAGARTTILLCDANLPPYHYRELTSALQSRGRNVIAVGTTYRIDPNSPTDPNSFIEAPVELSPSEETALRDLVAQYFPNQLDDTAIPDDWNMLAWVYRKISSGRHRVARGLSAEVHQAESLIRTRAQATPRSRHTSHLAEQLADLGIAGETVAVFDEDAAAAETGEDRVGRLINLVMVAGRLNVSVPLNLLMRVLSSKTGPLDYTRVRHLFENLDLFRWRRTSAEGSELLISPRLQLEAELVCRRRLAGIEQEIECIVDLICGVRVNGIEQAHERFFIIDLLQKLDRDGPRGQAYQQGYRKFANALRHLREQSGICDASLMLRECVFYRQTVFSQDSMSSPDQMPEEERLQILNTASEVIEEAFRLDAARKMHVSKRNRLHLYVERATIYGYLAVQRARSDDPTMWAEYQAAQQASLRATALADDYHPIDVALWTAADVLKEQNADEHKAQLMADLYSALDLAEDITMRPEQISRYEQRRYKVANFLEDRMLSDEALRNLESVAPATATFLRARQLAPEMAREHIASEEQIAAAARAADLLEDCPEALRDVQCLRLLIRMQWIAATGQRLFGTERGRTPSGLNTIDKIRTLATVQNEHLGDTIRNQDQYLEAVLTFLSGDFHRSRDLWRELARNSEFEDRSRIVRKLITTDDNGDPVDYSGRVRKHISGDRWLVDVDQIHAPINLLEHEFRSEQVARGRQLNRFWISFNYIGPIAEFPR